MQIIRCAIEALAEATRVRRWRRSRAGPGSAGSGVLLLRRQGRPAGPCAARCLHPGRGGDRRADRRGPGPGGRGPRAHRGELGVPRRTPCRCRRRGRGRRQRPPPGREPAFRPPRGGPVLAHLEQLLRDGQATGAFGDFDARSLAILIRGAIDTASGRLATDPAFDLAAYTGLLVSVVEKATNALPWEQS